MLVRVPALPRRPLVDMFIPWPDPKEWTWRGKLIGRVNTLHHAVVPGQHESGLHRLPSMIIAALPSMLRPHAYAPIQHTAQPFRPSSPRGMSGSVAVNSAYSFWLARGPTRCVPAGIMRFATSSSFSFLLLLGTPSAYTSAASAAAHCSSAKPQSVCRPEHLRHACMHAYGLWPNIPSFRARQLQKDCLHACFRVNGAGRNQGLIQGGKGSALGGVRIVAHELAERGVCMHDSMRLAGADVGHIAQRAVPGLQALAAQRVARQRGLRRAGLLAAAAELRQEGVLPQPR